MQTVLPNARYIETRKSGGSQQIMEARFAIRELNEGLIWKQGNPKLQISWNRQSGQICTREAGMEPEKQGPSISIVHTGPTNFPGPETPQ